MDRLEFEDKKGFITIDDKFIMIIYNGDENNKPSGKKFPLYAEYDFKNMKILYDVLKIANLGGHLLTEEALVIFDKYADKWKSDGWEDDEDDTSD